MTSITAQRFSSNFLIVKNTLHYVDFGFKFSSYLTGVNYGKGVYFARDASYSLKYSKRGSSGYCQMYVARVLVGRYTIGTKEMKAPPPINPTNPGLLYDSVVNDQRSPSIFVIFVDHQCYPEYLISFIKLFEV